MKRLISPDIHTSEHDRTLTGCQPIHGRGDPEQGAFVIELLMNLFANSNDCFRPFFSHYSNWYQPVYAFCE
jgi:hypothetical protein